MKTRLPYPWRGEYGWFAVVIAFCFFFLPVGRATNETFPDVVAAARPLSEGVPEVAVGRLRELLKNAKGEERWRAVATQLVPALIAEEQPTEALGLLNDPRLKNVSLAGYLRGQALAALGRWNDALSTFRAVQADPASPARTEAAFGAAEMLRALGQTEPALRELAALFQDKQWGVRAGLRSAELFLDRSDWTSAERLLDEMNPTSPSDRKERRFLRARVELARNRPTRAIGTFESLVKKPDGASHALVLAALFGLADAHLQLKTPETGDDFLEDFIDRQPKDENLGEIFAKLDQLYRAERRPARVELEKWTRESEQPRRAFAQWYRARIELRAGHPDRALQLFSDLRASGVKNPALAAAFLEFADLTASEGHLAEAITILDEARALQPSAAIRDRIDLRAGELQYANNRFDVATARFEQVAADSSSSVAKTARFNAALGWLQVGDEARFLADYQGVEKSGADKESAADLRLSEGLVEAAKGEATAWDSLQKFVRDFPQSPRLSEAWVALAELAFHATPPRLEEARKNLQRALEAKPTEVATEHADYLSIWLEDTAGNDAGVIDRATRFLTQHPESRFASDIRMKLAETYYRRQDFANAETQFENLGGQNPSGPIAEKALYFAGESAMSTMGPHSLDRAIELFDRVVQMKGEWRWSARNEQAVIERRLGKPRDALALYDEVLKSDARASDKREALCGKGDIYFELGPEDPANFDRAIQSYDQLAAESNQPGHWYNQALFKKGVCLEKKADREGALTIFYKVLEEQARPDRPPEFFWYYKAGFNAARLLEDAAKWDAAATVYEKLAASGGTRSEEAQTRLSRLRLEHFLWGN
jgi:TolA-binding protein